MEIRSYQGREKIVQTSNLLNDDLLINIPESNLYSLQYHVKTCYARYIKTGERYKQKQAQEHRSVQDTSCSSGSSCVEVYSPESRPKRRKTIEYVVPREQPCIICNCIKHKGVVNRYRISEKSRAMNFIRAYNFFKDDVHTRCILYKTPGDIFAADIMYHKTCLDLYFYKFRKDIESILSYEDDEINEHMETIFNDVVASLELELHGYALSDIRDVLNERLHQTGGMDCAVSNRQLKSMLISLFGVSICFSYPKDKKKSQMFFSTNIKTADVAETLRTIDPIKICAGNLRGACEEFDFNLHGSFHSPDDLEVSFEEYVQNRPWGVFFDTMFPYRSRSENIVRKCDVIFQIMFYLIHNGQRKTPFHVSLSESVHDTCRSKSLIQTMNRLGLCISYDELERIDINLAQRTIEAAGENRVPVPPVMQSSVMIHGAMDNFDNEENTTSGIGSSHDTILMLFQNTTEEAISKKEISKIPSSFPVSKRSLDHILDCQNLVKQGRFTGRGEISTDFQPQKSNPDQFTVPYSSRKYKLWLLTRYTIKSNISSVTEKDSSGIPSFTAANSLLLPSSFTVTKLAFTPIIPHPATEFDTIYTVMINFQDVLLQKGLRCGPLWSDEGVYRIAKELQLLNPVKFSNIFLGMGGFQSYIWLHAPFVTSIAMDPLEFGYTMDEKGLLVPEILSQPKLPDDFPVPCNCLKCARVNVCPCRVKNIPCCQFCKCKAGELCKNSHKL